MPALLKAPRNLALLAGACLVVAATLVVVTIARSGGGDGASAGSGAGATTRPARLETLFEDDGRLLADPPAALRLFRRLGVDRVRVFVPWGLIHGRPSIAPDPLSRTRPRFDARDPAAYPASGWAPYDAVVREAAAQNVALDVTLGPPAPLWATSSGEPAGGPLGNWRPSAREFSRFVRAFGTRYSGHYADPLRPGS